MTVPSRVEAAGLLLSLDPPAWFLRHSRAVAEIAAWLARAAAAAGERVDRPLVEAAALLHDVDKLPAVRRSPEFDRLPHGDGSAAWLRKRGYPELATAVAAHPVVRLADDAWWGSFQVSASIETRIVAYADKRAGQRLGSLEARFASWRRRYPPGTRVDGAAGWDEDTIERVRSRADTLEVEVCGVARIAPEAVTRLGWTGAAFSARSTATHAPGTAIAGASRR